MARSRVELFEQIRRDRRADGLSIRELAGRHRVHRRTVRPLRDLTRTRLQLARDRTREWQRLE